jgi:hypothetical protein
VAFTIETIMRRKCDITKHSLSSSTVSNHQFPIVVPAFCDPQFARFLILIMFAAAAFVVGVPLAVGSVGAKVRLPTHKARTSCLDRSRVVLCRSLLLRMGLFDDKDTKSDDVDWDASWKEFADKGVAEQSKGRNVFKLSGNDTSSRSNNPSDPRTGQLTSAWTVESGYLFGIALCIALAGFVAYTWSQSQSTHV